jgi:hypothetical protein
MAGIPKMGRCHPFLVGSQVCNVGDPQARCIAGDDGVQRRSFFNLLEDLLFEREILADRFDD